MKHVIFFIFLSLILLSCSKDKPETPEGLSAVSSDFSSITLIWNVSDNAEDYCLYRSVDLMTDFDIIYDGPNTNFVDDNLNYATTYYYQVSAKNKEGESALSAAVTASTQVPDGFDVTGSSSPNVNYSFNYLDDFNGKPRYQSDPIGLHISVASNGEYEGHWMFFDQIEAMVLYYHPDITDYPPATGWLKEYDDSETDIVLSPK
jgi:hypothetical protein